MFQEPMVQKVSGEIDRSIIIISTITVKFSIWKYVCLKETAIALDYSSLKGFIAV
jgi:hypothetical protein